MLYSLVKLIGLFVVLKKLIYVYQTILIIIDLKRKKQFNVQRKWVAVTGSTDGIGLAMVKYLSKYKIGMLIFGRNEEKLKNVQGQMKNNKLTTQIMDQSLSSFELKKILTQNKGKFPNLDLLINNAGSSRIKKLEDASYQEIIQQNNINIISALTLINFFQYNQDQSFTMLYISSFAYYHPFGYTLLYSFQKRTCSNLIKSYNSNKFHCAHIAGVSTKLNPQKGNGMFQISTEKCAHALLENSLFHKESYGHWRHYLFQALIPGFMNPLVPVLMSYVLKKQYLKKYQNK